MNKRGASEFWIEHDGELRDFHDQGLSSSAMAVRLKISRNAVIGRIHRLKLNGGAGPRRSIPASPREAQEMAARVRQLHGLGLGTSELGTRMGVSRQQVAHLLRRQGLAPNHRVGTTTAEGIRARAEDRRQRLAQLPQAPLDQHFKAGYGGQAAHVNLLDLKIHHCRFPIDRDEGGVGYCGLDAISGTSWCPDHAARVFNHVQPGARP